MALQNYAIVENGIVTNITVFDPEPKANWIRSDTAKIGDLWDGEKFTTPEIEKLPPLAPTLQEVLLKKGLITEDDLKPVMNASVKGEG